MDTTILSSELERRKSVRVRLRPNLVLSPQCHAGQTCHVVKDPVGLAYFRLDERQHFLVRLMDGSHTLEEIRKIYQREFRPQSVTLEELEHFASVLINSGLAQNESPGAGARLFERSERQHRTARWQSWLNLFNWKVPLLDPDRLLEKLLPHVRLLFAPVCLVLVLGLVLTAAGLLVTHWQEFLQRLPGLADLFGWRNLLCLWLLLGVVKILHELGHGLCCKALGGEVHEMGLQLLLFFPALYCDVSDSWMLPRKSRRIAISLAGIYVELLIASLATLVWWASAPAATLHAVCLGLMVVCGFNTVILNANPLMRFDGYYALSDWLEIPNLASQSARVVQAGALRWLGVAVPEEDPALARHRWLLTLYAVASYLYRWLVLMGVCWLLYTVLQPRKLGAVWYLFVLASLGMLVGWPVARVGWVVCFQGRFAEMKRSRLWLSAGIVAGVLAVIGLVPLPTRVQGVALLQVEPDQVHRVTISEGGAFLKELLVKDGQQVKAGEILAVLSNPELETKLRINEADQALRLQQKDALLAQPTESTAAEDQVASGLQQTEFELKSLHRECAALHEQLARLVLRAPCHGTILGLCSRQDVGKWLERGTELCRIGNAQSLRAILLVRPEDHERVCRGARAWVRVHGGGAARWPAVVTEIAQVEAKNIPAPLSRRAGGEVPTEQDPVAHTDQPTHAHYLCCVRLQAVDPVLQPGVLGRARLEAGSETLWGRFQRYLVATFGVSLSS